MITRIVGALAGLAMIALVVVLLVSGGSGGYTVKANLADADGLRSGSRVEIGGVQVGNVKKLQITSQDHALATLTIKKSDTPIGTDATVTIRPADLLGEKYLDLDVGNRSHPAPAGFTIPTAHTQDSADLDQVLDVLGPTTRDRVAILIHEAGVALFGRGRALQAALTSLPPSVDDAKALIQQTTVSNQNLEALLTHAGSVLQTVAAQRAKLGGFVATASHALAATAARQSQLSQTIDEAPGTLSALRTTLQRLDVAGDALRPASAGLVKTAPGLTATLHALPGFTAAALPTLAQVKSVAPSLTRLGRQASPVIARLRPTTQALSTLAGQQTPVLNSLNSGAANFFGTLQNWVRAIQPSDSLGHQFRVTVEVSPDLIKEFQPVLTNALGSLNPSTSAAATPSAPHRAAATPATHTTSRPRTPAPKPPSATTTTTTSTAAPAAATTTTSTATTATTVAQGVKGLLGYLLGK